MSRGEARQVLVDAVAGERHLVQARAEPREATSAAPTEKLQAASPSSTPPLSDLSEPEKLTAMLLKG